MQSPATWFPRERFAIAMLFVGLATAACLIPAQSDTWWQLRTGEEMWRSGQIMLRDEFTYTVFGQRWPNHEWLTQTVFYGVYRLGGLPLLTLFCASAIVLAWWIVSLLVPGPALLRVAFVGGGAMLTSPAWCLRPQVLTLTMCAATMWILVRWRHVWILPPLFLLWANLHGAVALGGVLVIGAWIACALADRARLRTITVIGALCLMATALTPLGLSLWLEIPHSLKRLQDYGVIEWRAPALGNPKDWTFWALAAGLATLAWLRRDRLNDRGTITLVAGSLLLFVLATRSMRNVAPFVVCATPALAALLGTDRIAWRVRPESPRKLARNTMLLGTLAAAAVVFIATAWSRPLPRLGWAPVSERTIAAIDSCPGRLYNRYDEGGYLIWFMRHRKVFIDSRQDPFPPELVLAHIELERTGEYQQLFNRYDVNCALAIGHSPLASALARDGWTPTDAGGAWKVYQRPRLATQ